MAGIAARGHGGRGGHDSSKRYGGRGGHGTRKGRSHDKSGYLPPRQGAYYHETASQGDAFVVRCHSLPPFKVGLASLNEGLDTFFYILALHNRLQIRQKLLYCRLFTFSHG